MKMNLSVGLPLLVVFSMFIFSGLAQPAPYPPCTPCIASVDGGTAAAIAPEGSSVVSSFEISTDRMSGTASYNEDLEDSLVTDGQGDVPSRLGIPEPKASSDSY